MCLSLSLSQLIILFCLCERWDSLAGIINDCMSKKSCWFFVNKNPLADVLYTKYLCLLRWHILLEPPCIILFFALILCNALGVWIEFRDHKPMDNLFMHICKLQLFHVTLRGVHKVHQNETHLKWNCIYDCCFFCSFALSNFCLSLIWCAIFHLPVAITSA